MADLKFAAERYRAGLLGGWLDVATVVQWADSLIGGLDNPPFALLDVSLSGSRTRAEVADLLAAMPGEVDRIAVTRSCLGDLERWMGNDLERAYQVAQWIDSIAGTDRLPESAFGVEPYSLFDDFALARQGYQESPVEAQSRLRRWLREAASQCGA